MALKLDGEGDVGLANRERVHWQLSKLLTQMLTYPHAEYCFTDGSGWCSSGNAGARPTPLQTRCLARKPLILP
jgi:hypothetical protein